MAHWLTVSPRSCSTDPVRFRIASRIGGARCLTGMITPHRPRRAKTSGLCDPNWPKHSRHSNGFDCETVACENLMNWRVSTCTHMCTPVRSANSLWKTIHIHSGSHVMHQPKTRQSAIRKGSVFGRMHVLDADTLNYTEHENSSLSEEMKRWEEMGGRDGKRWERWGEMGDKREVPLFLEPPIAQRDSS